MAIADAVDDASRRWAKRKAVSNGGQILFDGITTPYSCFVRDVSSTGARLEMSKNKYNPDAASGFVPTYFTLIIPLRARLLEGKSDAVDITFSSAQINIPIDPATMRP